MLEEKRLIEEKIERQERLMQEQRQSEIGFVV
jgi:hypothetical protein